MRQNKIWLLNCKMESKMDNNYGGPTLEENEFICLIVAYENTKKMLEDAKFTADSTLLRQNINNVINPKLINIFKEKRNDNWLNDKSVTEAMNQLELASAELDKWLTDFIVRKLDDNPKEFIYSRTNRSFNVALIRINKKYLVIKGNDLIDLKNEIEIIVNNSTMGKNL